MHTVCMPPVSTGEDPSYALHSDACAVMLQDLQHDPLVSYSPDMSVLRIKVVTPTHSQRSPGASQDSNQQPTHTWHTASCTPLEQPHSLQAQHQSNCQFVCRSQHTA